MPLKRLVLLCSVGLSLILFAPDISDAAQALTDTSAAASSPFVQVLNWIFLQQRAFHQDLIQALRRLNDGTGSHTGFWLILASFIYGVFHAAGPGHGKAVLSTYLLTNAVHIRRGMGLAIAAAFCQGLSAIVIVYGLIWLAGWRSSETTLAISWSERLSYILLIAMGLFLMFRSARGLIFTRRTTQSGEAPLTDAQHGLHDHTPDVHRKQAPSAHQIKHTTNLRTSIGMVLAIGLRPCSGAVLVLIFAYAAQIAWAGMLAVLAMAAGT
ncbi:MAG: hypothetical protein JXQ84_09835, partial [Rhodospirillaceae bacterium]|nr:hypothetical protein [Rhodospirillaceae bacterium]